MGRDNFSIGAETEEADDAVCDGTEIVEAAELMDVNDDVGRSEYKTSWFIEVSGLLTVGSETAAAVIVVDDDSTASEFSRALSGGTLMLGGVGSIWAPEGLQ